MQNSTKQCVTAALMGTAMAIYLGAQAPQGGRGGAAPPSARKGAMAPGPDDAMIVDPAAADRGRKTYAAECITCHGTHARGSERGADLIRSTVVLKDRYGDTIGPFLKKGHPAQTTPPANLTQAQLADLSHLIRFEVMATMRSGQEVQNVLTGDPKAGAAYFNGEGKCNTCHSPTGDLAGIGRRLTPVNIQQRFLFPMGGRGGRGGRGAPAPAGPSPSAVTVTVTPASGPAVSGVLVTMDDFNVSLRDASGEYHSFKRTPAVKIVKKDPFQHHIEMLDKYTDKNMHDITAYLETLK